MQQNHGVILQKTGQIAKPGNEFFGKMYRLNHRIQKPKKMITIFYWNRDKIDFGINQCINLIEKGAGIGQSHKEG